MSESLVPRRGRPTHTPCMLTPRIDIAAITTDF